MRSQELNNHYDSPLTPQSSLFYKLSLFATLLAFLVILLGSYVRLSNAGLGCPDWPGCYGRLIVPSAEHVDVSHPENDFNGPKAWKEMIHRYLAGALGLLVLFLALLAFFKRKDGIPFWTPLLLLILVIFQALLGMWTVTLKLHPLVVMSHLMGGYAVFILLAWQTFGGRGKREGGRGKGLVKFYVLLGLILLILQIILGGWLSANYASLACPDFPTCQGKWWPEFHFLQAFTFWHEFGPNYEWGILNNSARVTIHMIHRLGALVVFLYWGIFLTFLLSKSAYLQYRRSLFLILFCLITQVLLGISNIIFHLPLLVAVAHTGMAVLLLLSILNFWFHILKNE